MTSYKIKHTSTYTYSKEVFFEPFTLRLKPKCNNFQTLKEFKLSISPKPDGSTETLDVYDNNINTIWFSGTHKKLVIKTESVVQPLNKNPYNYIITDDSFSTLPVLNTDISLRPFLKLENNIKSIRGIINTVLKQSENQTIQFLGNLNSFIYENFEKIIRETGKPWTAARTVKENKGSCRDLAMLFMQCSRACGLPARFTSGYNEIDIETDDRHLHGWAEVYIPGAGWRGYDPTLGLAVADKHIAVASTTDPSTSHPVTGTFRATGATTELKYKIEIYESA